MSYNRLERGLASLLDAAPGVRRLAKSGYQRINYLLRGGRGDCLRLHPDVSIERIGAGTGAELDPAQQYFFGYFGVSPWSADGKRYLFHRWLQGRPTIDLCVQHRGDSTPRVLGTSRTWNFQQGSMTQWLPQAGGAAAIVFNDCRERRLCCRIVTADGHERSFDWPIQAVHPHGTHALSLNYLRLSRVQPEYGYDVVADNFSAELPVDQDGLWRVDLQSGASGLLVSLQDLEEHAPRADMGEAEHQVNHAVYSPGGKRIVFMHRWLGRLGKFSRLFCAAADGSDLRLLLDHRMVSHYAWRDDNSLLVWARAPEHGDRYYVIDVTTGRRDVCGAGTLDRFGDGHPSFSPDGRWIVTDSYPDRARMRHLLLCRLEGGEVIEAGAFHSPWRYDGAVRCDLHPRWSPDGRSISIDSAHEGVRRTYAVDVSQLVRSKRD